MAWGHKLQRLSDEQQARLRRMNWDWDRTCRGAKTCHQLVTHLVTFQYVTGSAGRVSWQSRYMCDAHAEKFRVKHDLPAPEVQPIPRHALERILGGDAS